jgi:hypothetical protein
VVDKKCNFYYIYNNIINAIKINKRFIFFNKIYFSANFYNFNETVNLFNINQVVFDLKKIKIRCRILNFFKKNFIFNMCKKINFLKVFNMCYDSTFLSKCVIQF